MGTPSTIASRARVIVAGLLLLGCAHNTASAQNCIPALVPHHVPPITGKVYAMVLFDDDHDGVPSIYVGGDQFTFQGQLLGGVAKLENNSWIRPGAGVNAPVRSMLVWDRAGTRSLIVGSASVLEWDGSQWAARGAAFPGPVQSLAVFDNGTGPSLYAGGTFSNVYRLVENSWVPAAPGSLLTASRVQSLVVFDADGPGGQPASLFASGTGLRVADRQCLIARLDSSGWHAEDPAGSNWLKTMIAHDDGTGTRLYTSGSPTPGSPFSFNAQIASFDGTQWRSIATPLTMTEPLYSMASFQEQLGQARVLWGQTNTQLIRAQGGAATVRAAAALTPADFSAVTPLVLPAVAAGPECLLFPVNGGFVKLAGCPRLAADITLDGSLSVEDIFEYLGFWFALDPLADFDRSGRVTPTDIFAFLNAWFAGV